MAYERQYYTNGDVLEARQLNHMETGIKENSDTISKLSEDIATKASAIKEKASGEVIVVTDSDEQKPLGLAIDGKSTQDGEPTPDNLIEIVNVGKYDEASGKYAVEVKLARKNRLKNMVTTQTVDGVTITVNEDRSIVVNGTPTKNIEIELGTFSLISGNEYMLSGCPSGGSAETYCILLYEWDSNWQPLASGNDVGNGLKFTHYSNAVNQKCAIRLKSGVEISNLVFKPMIRPVGTDGTYEQWQEITATVLLDEPLCGIPVSSGGNYTDSNGQQYIADEIVIYADGSGERIQRVGKGILNGSERWIYNDAEYRKMFYFLSAGTVFENAYADKSKTTWLADKLIAEKWNSIGNLKDKIIGVLQKDSVFIRMLDYIDVTEFTNFLSENPVTVYFALIESIHTPLTAEEIAEIEKLSMFYPTTILSNDCNANMKVTYIADTKNYIDKLKTKHESDITALKTAIVALGGTV
jgi:hypothetical protein